MNKGYGYCVVRFEEEIPINLYGDTEEVRALAEELGNICLENYGALDSAIERLGAPDLIDVSRGIVKRDEYYLVGGSLVRNSIDLVDGKRMTSIMFLWDYRLRGLINAYEDFYGKDKIVEDTRPHLVT